MCQKDLKTYVNMVDMDFLLPAPICPPPPHMVHMWAGSHDVNTNQKKCANSSPGNNTRPNPPGTSSTITYYRVKLVTQSTWTDQKSKKQSLTPHLGFLKHIGDVATDR